MNFLVWLLFESTPALAGCLAVVLFVLLVHWRRTLKPRPFLIGLAVAVVLLVVQALVVTRREHADRILGRIETDIVASRMEALATALAPGFYIPETDWDRARFLDRVQQYMERVDVRTLIRRQLEVEAGEADRFQIEVSYLADVSAANYAGAVFSRWRITFVEVGDQWQILTVEPISLNQHSVHGWDDLPAP